ncbi:2-amino-4-hydroxy-6-hydroxymethyldihydropteridine diphosphokinase [Arcanobacterium canis]
MNLDSIHLSGLTLVGTHGVLDFEHADPQTFIVDVTMSTDTSLAARTDSVYDTISYADVADAVAEVVEGPHVDLIETLAARIADAVLALGPIDVRVVVHKPGAPLERTFSDVGVEIYRQSPLMRNVTFPRRVVIALGSNVGDSLDTLRAARAAIEEVYEVEEVSDIYRTAPVLAPGQRPQADYYNAVMIISTTDGAVPLLENLQWIEDQLGRVRGERWGSRTLDLDIVDMEGVASDSPTIAIPHPRAKDRRFVLEPWAQIEPDARLSGEPIQGLLGKLPQAGIERLEGAWSR